MLRITVTRNSGNGPCALVLEGRLEGPWVSEVSKAWELVSLSARTPVEVTLDGVTYASETGAELLRSMQIQGAEFTTNSPLTNSWLEDLLADGTERIGRKSRS